MHLLVTCAVPVLWALALWTLVESARYLVSLPPVDRGD